MSKLRGIGIDLCAIDRMENMSNRDRFLSRYYTEEEIAYITGRGKAAGQSMAGIYAAKEAFVKALGIGLSVALKDVGVMHTLSGQPCYAVTGKAAELIAGCSLSLSITHEGSMSAAVCIIMEEKD